MPIVFVLAALSAAGPPVETASDRARRLEVVLGLSHASEARNAGGLREAASSLRAIMAAELRRVGAWHPTTEAAAWGLALVCREQGEWEEAARNGRLALEARRRLLGEAHWQVTDLRLFLEEVAVEARLTAAQRDALRGAKALNERSAALYQGGDGARALPLIEKALEARRSILGQKHRETLDSLAGVAKVRRLLGDPRGAVDAFLKAYEAQVAARGDLHPETVSARVNLSIALRDAGRLREALAHGRLSLARHRLLHGEGDPAYPPLLSSVAEIHLTLGEYAEARRLAELAVRLGERSLGRRHPHHAQALNTLARLHKDLGELTAALPLSREALKVTRDALGERHRDYAAALHNNALLLRDMGDLKAALPLLEKAVRLARDLAGERHPFHADALQSLSDLHQARGGHAAALPLLQKAMSIRKAALGEKHLSYILGLNSLAQIHLHRVEMKEALKAGRRAAELAREAAGERSPVYMAALFSLATVEDAAGEGKAALATCRRALALRKEVFGERHPDYASGLGTLATLHEHRNEYAAALPLRKQVARTLGAALGERHPGHVGALFDLAQTFDKLGDFESALEVSRRGIRLCKDLADVNHRLYPLGLSRLARSYLARGEAAAGLPLAEEALRVASAAFGETHREALASLMLRANLSMRLGRFDDALADSRRALALFERVYGERHPDTAAALNNLSAILYRRGEYKEARVTAARGLALASVLGMGSSHHHPTHLTNMAGIHLSGGEHKEALALCEKALGLALKQIRDGASVQSERQQLALAADMLWHLEMRLSINEKGDGGGAWAAVLAWKGAVLMRQQVRRLFLRLPSDPHTRAAADRLLDATRRMAALKQAASVPRETFEAQTEEFEEAQGALAALSAEYRREREAAVPTPAALAAALPADAALVDFIFHANLGLKDLEGRPAPRRQLAAFVCRRGGAPARVGLGDAGPIEAAVKEWRLALGRKSHGGAAGARLKKLIWAPLERHLAGAKVVLISPDGVLGTVPFAALPGKKDGYLIEDVALAYIPSPRAILELTRPDAKEGRLPPSLLVAGDLRYDPDEKAASLPAGDDTRQAPRTGRPAFARLPATREEILAVKASFSSLFRAGTVTDLREADASKPAVARALGRVRYAHLATHGYFSPESAHSALDEAERSRRRAGLGGSSGWHPLLLSGLALSDANRAPEAGKEDGILTALEVSEMDLSKLELAVLSACETGLGKVAGGEGLLGMQRAFQAAGARTVVGSLWKVDDKATRQLMADFYAAAWDTRKIISRAEALRHAQLGMMRDGVKRGTVGELEAEKGTRRVPPYYWAGFVLSGDWR